MAVQIFIDCVLFLSKRFITNIGKVLIANLLGLSNLSDEVSFLFFTSNIYHT